VTARAMRGRRRRMMNRISGKPRRHGRQNSSWGCSPLQLCPSR
jgi:hypothetical protein